MTAVLEVYQAVLRVLLCGALAASSAMQLVHTVALVCMIEASRQISCMLSY